MTAPICGKCHEPFVPPVSRPDYPDCIRCIGQPARALHELGRCASDCPLCLALDLRAKAEATWGLAAEMVLRLSRVRRWTPQARRALEMAAGELRRHT